MKHIIILSSLSFLFTTFFSETFARSKRVNQIPNGSVFSCRTCHLSPSGGSRNLFGQEIEDNFLTAAGSAGDVDWGSALAIIDSDNDGDSNGFELQDPDGSWMVGQGDPGNSADVTNPGDASSTAIRISQIVPYEFSLEQNYPNPFNPVTKIQFSIDKAAHAKLTIYNLSGREIKVLVDNFVPAGRYQALWDARDNLGHKVSSGTYIYQLRSGQNQEFRKMLLIK
jgi:hypothetical protein